MEIQVNADKKTGKIKPLHGVNNGPVCYGALLDVSEYYREAGVPSVRLHDPNWPHPREVDIPQIFTDFDADPEDPASYDFRRTDDYIKSILDTGAQIVYRLGTSIEHTKTKYYIHPPRDYDKWARICIGIIRHYNEGWANGFHYGIRYWEIWNEPDGHPDVDPARSGMWTGTHQQYFDLYQTAATAIKQHDPSLMVGGYAATMIHPVFMEKFLDFVRKEKPPLDFFSWHTYTDSLELIERNAHLVRKMLDERGLAGTESHFNEWNYIHANTGVQKDIWAPDAADFRREVFERCKNQEGASFAAAALLQLQDLPVDVANYYDGQPTALYCGLFDYYGVPQKTWYAFKAFQQLYACGERVEVCLSRENKEVYACAAVQDKGGKGAVLISNPAAEEKVCRLMIRGLRAGTQWQEYVLDEERDLQLISSKQISAAEEATEIHLGKHSVVLIEFTGQ